MEIDRRRAPPLGQNMVVWHDAAQLKSTQLRMADMDRCTQDMPDLQETEQKEEAVCLVMSSTTHFQQKACCVKK